MIPMQLVQQWWDVGHVNYGAGTGTERGNFRAHRRVPQKPMGNQWDGGQQTKPIGGQCGSGR